MRMNGSQGRVVFRGGFNFDGQEDETRSDDENALGIDPAFKYFALIIQGPHQAR